MIKERKPWVLMDLSYLAYRAMHTIGKLSYGDIGPTGVLFGFFNQLKMICQDPKVNSNKIILFFDSRISFRKRLYPTYKEKRRKDRTPEDITQIRLLYKQVNILRTKILPAIGLPVCRQTGLESDDLIAMAARQLSNPGYPGRQAVIITGDGDLFQCITHAVHWYDPQRGLYWTPDTFKKEKGIRARRWGKVKTLAGCHSDNVAGIPRIGEATAIKYLNGVLPVNKAHTAINSPLGQKIIKRNKKLVCLPHSKTEEVRLLEPKIDIKAFFRIAKKYGFSSFIRNKISWTAFWQGRNAIPKLRRKGE